MSYCVMIRLCLLRKIYTVITVIAMAASIVPDIILLVNQVQWRSSEDVQFLYCIRN